MIGCWRRELRLRRRRAEWLCAERNFIHLYCAFYTCAVCTCIYTHNSMNIIHLIPGIHTGSGVSFVLYLSKQRYFTNTAESFIVHNTHEINVSHQAITWMATMDRTTSSGLVLKRHVNYMSLRSTCILMQNGAPAHRVPWCQAVVWIELETFGGKRCSPDNSPNLNR